MIRVTIQKTCKDAWKGFSLEGHADAAESGRDVICAAVSMLVLNTVNSVERFTEDAFRCDAAQDGGYLEFIFTGEVSDASALLLDSMEAGLQDVEKQYGKRYINIRYEEV